MARKQYSPQERLGDFILNKEASQSNVEILRNFLNGFEPIQRKRIINAPLTQYFSRTSVHLAAEKGLTPFLLILLKHGGNPNVESSLTDLKQTPLHLAAMGGYWQCMEVLLEYKAKHNVEDLRKRTPHDHINGRPKCKLVVAHHIAKYTIPQRNQAEEKLVLSLHKMMKDDDKIQFKEDYNHLANHFKDLATRWLDSGKYTLLYSACYYGCKEIVELMLEESEHTPLANLIQGDTPLHCACNNDNIKLVEMLLNHSPRLGLVCNAVPDKRYTPLHIVCKEKGKTRMVELLLQAISLLLETDEYSEDSPLDMNVRDANGCTPLYYACYFGHNEIVTQLLEFGQQNKKCKPFDARITTLQKRTPLHAAVQKNHISTLQILLDHCANHKITSIVNFAGYPSSHTSSRLLRCFPSVRSSIISCTSITSQQMENSGDEYTGVVGEQHMSQTLPTNSKHTPLAFTQSDNHSMQSKVPHKPLKARAFTLIPVSQQQPELKRERSKTDSSFYHMSLYMTKDGTFLVHPTEIPPENVDKRFDEMCITPLAEACAFGYSQVVNMLLSAGASDPEGMAVRLAQLTGNYTLAHTILSHHCTMIVETSIPEHPIYTLSIDWNNMKIVELFGSGFVERSLFYPSSAKDGDGCDLLMISELPRQLNASLLTNVVLTKNNLSSLPVELLQLPNIECLDISSNHITNISPKISMNSLKYLYLGSNKLIKLPMTIWYLQNLLELKVNGNVLQSLDEDSIDPSKLSKSVAKVDISSNHFETLPEFLLELSALEELNVSRNKLTNLPSNIWDSCTLKELNASNNHLFELPLCEPQSAFTSSLQSPNAALRHGKKFFGARMNVRFQTDGGVFQKRRTIKFVKISQQIYSEDYIYNNEGCCSIEKLLLSRNNLSTFPDALPCLVPLLTELDISDNKIEEIDILFLPPMLRKLKASHNKIVKFGNFVDFQIKHQMAQNCRVVQVDDQQLDCHHRIHKQMRNLAIINLANNQLKHFQLIQAEQTSDPLSITNCSQLDLLYPELENLDISHNCLQGCFNHNIGYQSQLKSIVLDGNLELEELPMEFAYFKKSKMLTKMSLHNLPKLRDPPKEYHDKKLRALLSYMSSRLKKSEYYRYIKLIVVGCGERGKTTLLHRLRGSSIENIDRTVGIDIEPWTYHHSGQLPITFITLDFAGQDIYNTTHQCFYSQRSLYLALYRLSDTNGVAELDSWLRNIKLRAPGSPVIVIGTHLDQVKDAVAREREEQVKQQYSNRKLYPTIVDVCSVSCVKKGFMKKMIRSDIDQLRTTLYQIASHLRVAPDGLKLTLDQKMSQNDPESLFQQKIPQSYLKLQESVTDTLRAEKMPVMRGGEFREKFLSVMDDEEELSDAVQYLHHQGTLLHFTDQALKDVYFLDPQWLCKMMASVIRVPPAGKKSIVTNGSIDIKDLFTESKDLQAFKDECINLLSKFDIALRLKNHHLLVPSLLPVDPPSSLSQCINDNNQLLNDIHSSDSESIVYPPLRKFWFSKFIPNGFWPRLICRLTTNQNINTILKLVFPLLVDECDDHSSKDDMFLPWMLWRSGLALTCKKTLLLEIKEVTNNSEELTESMKVSVKDSRFRVEVCVNAPGWMTILKSLDSTYDQDIAGPVTSVMVEIVKHVSSLATDWFPGMFDGECIEGQVPCYVPCWKCCYQSNDDVLCSESCLEECMPALSVEMNGHRVHCWEFNSIITPAIKGKPIWCDLHCLIDPQKLTPELFFRDLDNSIKKHKQALWIDKERELGKGAFGVVLRGELETQESDKIPVAIKVLLPQTDSKPQQRYSLEQVLKTTSANQLIPQSYHDVRQEVSVLSRLHHDNLTKLHGVHINSIIPGTTPMIFLMLELASCSLRNVLKKYKTANMLIKPLTLKTTICQIASGLNYLHEHQIAHLDIKSPNILVWKFPLQFSTCHDRLEDATEVLVKIADYGTSQSSTLDSIVAKSSIGTPGYMSPELFSHQGQEISSSKVDVFAFGITVFELLTARVPYDEYLHKDGNTLHKLVREGKRPMLSDKEAQAPVLILDMMERCWDPEPNNRPSMSQVVQCAESIEFENLRVDSNLAQVTAISTACVIRIDSEIDSCLGHDSNDHGYTIMKSQTITQNSVTSSKDETNDTEIQPRNSRDRSGTVFRKVGSISELQMLPKGSSQVKLTACTQIWLCGRDKRKGLLAIFTYEDDKPGYSLFYGYACTQEIKVICAVDSFVWLGSANGELRIIHAPTMKTKFVRSLNSKESISACILDIVHVKADHKVIVSTQNCDVWIFSDVLDKGGLRQYSHLQFPDEQEVFHMAVVDVNGSPEVWGTRSENKIVVFQRHQSKWDYSELQCEPFSDGHLLTVALATSSVFTGKQGDTRSHIWVSFNRRAYIVCWDAMNKKQLHIVDCKQCMQIDERGLLVSSLLASGQFVYVGTSVGVIGVWSSEDAKLLQKFHYHEHKVRMLLEMPLQVSPCVCPEVPFLKDNDHGDIEGNRLITSIGNGHRKLLLHASSTGDSKHLQKRHDNDICLLTWHCWK